MSYGANTKDPSSVLANSFRDFQGQAAADIPFEQPTRYLVVNLKTAKAIGLTMPPTLVAPQTK